MLFSLIGWGVYSTKKFLDVASSVEITALIIAFFCITFMMMSPTLVEE